MFVHIVYSPQTTILKARENNGVVTLIIVQGTDRLQVSGTKEDMERFFNVVSRILRNPEKEKLDKVEVA